MQHFHWTREELVMAFDPDKTTVTVVAPVVQTTAGSPIPGAATHVPITLTLRQFAEAIKEINGG